MRAERRRRAPAEKVTPMSVARSRAVQVRTVVVCAAAGLAIAGATSACTTGSHPSAGGSPAGHGQPSPSHVPQNLPPAGSSPTISASPAPASPAASPSVATPAQPVAAQPPACATGSLRVTVGPPNGAAGSAYYPLLFTNASPVPCVLYGYPGVALVSQPGGRVLGAPAVRNATFPKEVVRLAPGAVAHASLQVIVAANYPPSQCQPATAHWLQVYPPGEYTALFARFTAQTCTAPTFGGSTLGIYVVRPGSTGP